MGTSEDTIDLLNQWENAANVLSEHNEKVEKDSASAKLLHLITWECVYPFSSIYFLLLTAMQRYYSTHIVPEVILAALFTPIVGMRYFHVTEHPAYRSV